MKIRMGEYLVEKKVISAAELDLALHRQLIYGGRIGTNLVKLGLISEDVLISLLQVMKNAKGINLRKVGELPRAAIASVNRDATIKFKCIPFEVFGSRIKVAFIDTLTPEQLRELEHITGKNVSPYIFPEIQWIEAMKTYYDYDPSEEEDILKGKGKTETLQAEGATAGVLPIWKQDEEKNDELRLILEDLDYNAIKRAEFTFTDLKEIESYLEQDSERFSQTSDAPPIPGQNESLDVLLSDEDFFTDYRERTGWKRPKVVDREEPAVERISLAEATIMLARARNRDQVAITLLTLACNYVDDAILFFVTPENIKGWMGMGKNVDKNAVRDFSFSLLTDSLFLDIIKAGSIYSGPAAISTSNRAVFKLLNAPWPREICIFPIIVQNRIVALLYMANYQEGISKQTAVNIQLLARKAAITFEILIFRLKMQIKGDKVPGGEKGTH